MILPPLDARFAFHLLLARLCPVFHGTLDLLNATGRRKTPVLTPVDEGDD
jgi:hypothetical protein